MSPELPEASQALFCSLADYVLTTGGNVEEIFNAKQYSSYDMFQKYWDNTYKNKTIKQIYSSHTDTGKTDFTRIEDFLQKNPDWLHSSIEIAKRLVEDIDRVVVGFKGLKKPKPSEIWFVRGDKDVMSNIQKLFTICNETRKEYNRIAPEKEIVFSDINRWSPADIYFSTDKARKEIENVLKQRPNGYSFTDLNLLISDLIKSGNLLPLSLKKTEREATLLKVNFDREQELKEISKLGYFGIRPWKLYKINSPQARYLEIFISADKRWSIVLRHDPSTNAFKAEIKVKGGTARFGSLSEPESIKDLLSIFDSSFASSYYKTITNSSKDFLEKRKQLGPKPPKGSKLKETYDQLREEASALYVTNKNIPPLIKWLDSDEQRAERFVRLVYEFCTSRTIDSAKFVVAKQR